MKGNERLELAAPRAPFVGHVLELPLRPLRRLVRVDSFGQRSENLGGQAGSLARSGDCHGLSGLPSRKTGEGRPGAPSKKLTLRSSRRFKCAFPMTPSTQRREVRAVIRSAILRSDDVVANEVLGLTTLRAAVAVSVLHPPCLPLPPALVQRRTG
jgi:hypothetical protein